MLVSTLVLLADLIAIPIVESQVIRADGVFTPEERDCSSMMGGLINIRTGRLAARDADVYLSSDDAALHVAVRWSVEGSETDGGFVAQVRKDGDKNVCFDDVTEIFVASMDGKHVYQLCVNAANARYWKDAGEIPPTACRISGGHWTIEATLPWRMLEGVDPQEFKFNLARNFVAANLGYASLSGQPIVGDASKMVTVRGVKNFGGVRVFGMDTSLISGRYRLWCEGSPNLQLKSELTRPLGNRQHKVLLVNNPAKEQAIPVDDKEYRAIRTEVTDEKLGCVFQRAFLPFEGGSFAGGPVTDKRRVEGYGYAYTRRYSSASKVAVIAEGIPKDRASLAELRSPGGKVFRAPFVPQPDSTSKAMIGIPAEKGREEGEWVGSYVIGDERVEGAFGFKEEHCPWAANDIGKSTKILKPFTPIEVEGNVLRTVLREHTMGSDGMIKQVRSLGRDVLAAPMQLELMAGGRTCSFDVESFRPVVVRPHEAQFESKGSFGSIAAVVTSKWEYDGLAYVSVRLVPKHSVTVERLTLKTPMRKEHATLFHSLVDMTRGNPAGYIPKGEGVVWDSSKLLRRKNPMGAPWVPGEFCPYLWLGAEERGIAFVFDSPRGFDLEDGKPMLRLVRDGDVVTAECDIVNRVHKVSEPFDFSFAYQVTPVKPRYPGWRNWCFDWGQQLPGLTNIKLIGRECGTATQPKRYMKQPEDTNKWCYAESLRKVTRARRPDLDTLVRMARKDYQENLNYGERNRGFLKSMGYKGGVRGFADMILNYSYDEMVWQGMTLDRVLPYSCASIINVDDPGYLANKAEWSTLVPYARAGGTADRCFLVPSLVDYLLWCYKQMLEHGADGIYFDEQYVIPQSNPDLSTVRDYKGRCIPEMGILAGRELYKRLAYLVDEMKLPERLICIHATNTMIVPEFSFTTLAVVWEYGLDDVFQTQFPFDYCRAHSTGLQAGLVTSPLVIHRDPNRAKRSPEEFHRRRQHFYRTALGIAMQHEMWQTKAYWGDDSEHLRARQVFWMFGTHLDDATFIPYWKDNGPFRVTEGFYVGAYERGGEYLIMISSDTDRTEAELMLPATGYETLIDVYTGEEVDPRTIKIADHEYRLLFLGSKAFGRRLKPAPADYRYINK